MESALLLIAIILVLLYDYSNGFHDAANIIATVVASRAMTPMQAVAMVALFEFLGPLLGGTAVANTIAHFVNLDGVATNLSLGLIVAGMAAAILWNGLTWRLGIPSSSSHALVGGLIGAVLAGSGSDQIVWGIDAMGRGELQGVAPIVLALILSPLLGFAVGFLLFRLTRRLLAGARPSVNRPLRRMQWLSSAGLAFSHGANDAQKSMGILTLVLMLGGQIDSFVVPLWVVLACALALTAGVLSGGWRIVRTLGFSIYKLRPLHALDSQLSAATIILAASVAGAPVSTTHVVGSSIMGIGAAERPRAVRWSRAGQILITWGITVPGTALCGGMLYWLGARVGG